MTTEPAAASKCCQVIEDGNYGADEDQDDEPEADQVRLTTIATSSSLDHLSQEVRKKQQDKFCQLGQSSIASSIKLQDKLCDISRSAIEQSNKTNNCRTTSIDSRSILTNKERLKKFWESRMEMEFKSRQQRELTSSKDDTTSAGAKLADENNNNNSNNNSSSSSSSNGTNGSGPKEANDDEQQQQVVNLSDEEWRSLSPAVDVPPSGEQQTRQPRQKVAVGEEVPNQIRSSYDKSHYQELQQLMSIDPTLCHSSDDIQGKADSSILAEELEEEEQEERSSVDLCPMRTSEEQTINEEFSSTSGSSFGPMSISVTQQQEEDDDEPNDSTLSGSVSTVIAKAKPEPNDKDNEGDIDEDDAGSNIGVAFESLHFDSEIKSSKQEKVDEHLLLVGPAEGASAVSPAAKAQQPQKTQDSSSTEAQQAQSQAGRFSAREVKSVCNLITVAISDASRQVESFLQDRRNSSPSSRAELDDRDEMKTGRNIERATFVEATQVVAGEEMASSDNETMPKVADLSSIFEANVRREIQRFEKHSNMNSPTSSRCGQQQQTIGGSGSGGKLSAASSASTLNGGGGGGGGGGKGGLTEWRIAEEIRLFNEREMELKSRLVAGGGSNKGIASNKKDECADSQVVRFGKTLRIPKSIASEDQHLSGAARASAGIKLSSSLAPAGAQLQQQPAISMHKFIASGGKRFVLTAAAPAQQPHHHHHHHHHQHHLSKSMSSLSMTGSSLSVAASGTGGAGSATPTHKPADYKAVDSLRCKETPNVEPGMARKVIESFSRLRGQQQQPTSAGGSACETRPLSGAASSLQLAQPHPLFAGGQRMSTSTTVKGSQQQNATAAAAATTTTTTSMNNCNNTSSAEWKIQEELREMRAREAELRNQQKQQQQLRMQQQQQQQHQQADIIPSNDKRPGDDDLHDDLHDDLEEEAAAGNERTGNMDEERVRHSSQTSRLAREPSSSESLYPIKQTIDSFRRLNSSPSQSQQQQQKQTNGTQPKRHSDDSNNNYGSKVGTQRRKMALIERWEFKNNVC